MASRGINKIMLLGHVGKDPEVRYTNNGKAVATFSLATSEGWRDGQGELQERTTWHNIVVWDRLAEICKEYVKKGKQLYIEGRIQNRSYDDKDGNKRYITEVVANELILLGGGGSGDRSGDGGSSRGISQPHPVESMDQAIPDSDLPF